MRLWVKALLVALASNGPIGCSHREAPRPRARTGGEQPATPADAPPRAPHGSQYAGGEMRPGWARYEQRKTLKVGHAITAGPEPYARLKLIGVADDRHSAVFEAQYLVDLRRGRVVVGESFNVFTPVFGSKGAKLEAVDAAGATVVFHWSQGPGQPVPPGAVEVPPSPSQRESGATDGKN